MTTCETKPQIIYRILDPINKSIPPSNPDILHYEVAVKTNPNLLLISNKENAYKLR